MRRRRWSPTRLWPYTAGCHPTGCLRFGHRWGITIRLLGRASGGEPCAPQAHRFPNSRDLIESDSVAGGFLVGKAVHRGRRLGKPPYGETSVDGVRHRHELVAAVTPAGKDARQVQVVTGVRPTEHCGHFPRYCVRLGEDRANRQPHRCVSAHVCGQVHRPSPLGSGLGEFESCERLGPCRPVLRPGPLADTPPSARQRLGQTLLCPSDR
jgi:hypothetical protein